MNRFIKASLALGIVAVLAAPLHAQEGIAEKLGKRLDRGLNKVSEELRQGWAEIRTNVDRLSVQGRVYSRLRWDKATTGAPIDIQVRDENIIVLSGSVSKETARVKAVELARDTVGVSDVIDELKVVPTKPAR